MSNVGAESFIDRLSREAVSYAEMYHLPESFVAYCVGAASHSQGIASSEIDEYLDYWRKSYSDWRERIDSVSSEAPDTA